MSNVTGSATVNAAFQQIPTTGFMATENPVPVLPIGMSLNTNFQTNGTAANQIQLGTGIHLSLVASTPQTIDLTALTDLQGNAFSLAAVRYLAIRNNSTTDTQNLTVGGAATPFVGFWSSTVTIWPSTTGSGSANQNSGYEVFQAPNTTGAPVTGGSKLLKFDPGANAFTVDIIVMGY
jgi:hypothetical protein